MGKTLICLAGGLALTANLRADEVVLPGNPYAPVVARNIFGLNPPTPPVDTALNTTPPPKITVNGITDILGQMQALFKVAGTAKPGKPAGDDAYILSEGQRQDDIEVVKIDEKAGIVTFNNHGETQQLPLAVATSSTTPAPAPSISTGNPGALGSRYNPGLVNPGGGNYGTGLGARNRGTGNSGGNSGNNFSGRGNGLNFDKGSTPNSTYVEHPAVDPAVQTVLIEANRAVAQQQNDPTSIILPITELTPPDP
jgi:hypothetical protein